jgi:hypothetical protein
MCAILRAEHVGHQHEDMEMRQHQHEHHNHDHDHRESHDMTHNTMIGPLSYPMFATLFKAFIECELAVVTTMAQGNHSAASRCDTTINTNLDMDTSTSARLELQEPDATNYYGHYPNHHHEEEKGKLLRQEENTTGISSSIAQAYTKIDNNDNNHKKKVSFCPFSTVTPAVDKLTQSHHPRQHCILALSELLEEATILVNKSRSYLWNEFVLSRMTHALEQLIGGLDSMIDIDIHIHSNVHKHKHATVAQRLRTEFQGILEACLDTCGPGPSSARSRSMSITTMAMVSMADDDIDTDHDEHHRAHEQPLPPPHPQPLQPQARPLVLCPMAHVQLDTLLSAQIRFHLRR